MKENESSECYSICKFSESEISSFQENIKQIARYCDQNGQDCHTEKLKILFQRCESYKQAVDKSWFSDVSDASNDNRKTSECTVAEFVAKSAHGDTHPGTLANSRKTAGGQS